MNDRVCPASHADRLLRAGDRGFDPEALVRSVGIRAGETVLDLGCGPGLFEPYLAAACRPGLVYAADIQQEMLNRLRDRVVDPRVVPLLTSEGAIPLPDACVDLVFMVASFHEVDGATLLEVARVLRPGGRATVIDWRPGGSDGHGPPQSHRRRPEEVAAAIPGLVLVRVLDLGPDLWGGVWEMQRRRGVPS